MAPHSSRYHGTTVLLLGASGFIGRAVARALAVSGARLHTASRQPQALRSALGDTARDASIARADITDPRSIGELVRGLRPDITFNLAGYGVNPAERDEASARAVNAEGARHIAEAVAELPRGEWPFQRLVHAGSALEYGSAAGDLREDTEPHPTSLYGRTKLDGTLAVASVAARSGVRAVTARLFMVYGPGERAGRLVPSLIAASRDGTSLRLTSGAQRRDFTYLDDAAGGLLRLGASDADPGTIVNVATGVLTSIRDFVLTAAHVLAIPAERLHFGALPARPEEMQHDPVDVTRLRELIGWVPACTIEEGIRRTLAAER